MASVGINTIQIQAVTYKRKAFKSDFLGSPGSGHDEQADVTGYLVDQRFETHVPAQAASRAAGSHCKRRVSALH